MCVRIYPCVCECDHKSWQVEASKLRCTILLAYILYIYHARVKLYIHTYISTERGREKEMEREGGREGGRKREGGGGDGRVFRVGDRQVTDSRARAPPRVAPRPAGYAAMERVYPAG